MPGQYKMLEHPPRRTSPPAAPPPLSLPKDRDTASCPRTMAKAQGGIHECPQNQQR